MYNGLIFPCAKECKTIRNGLTTSYSLSKETYLNERRNDMKDDNWAI